VPGGLRRSQGQGVMFKAQDPAKSSVQMEIKTASVDPGIAGVTITCAALRDLTPSPK